MPYRLAYHRDIIPEDLPEIPANVRARIAHVIQTRLTTGPERYGSPLRGTLRGYWRLRVGDYRVVYRIAGDAVPILAISHRKSMAADGPGARFASVTPRQRPEDWKRIRRRAAADVEKRARTGLAT